MSESDGLLAVGGDLSSDRLLLAYRSGIFPWFNDLPILWWSPDPRFILYPHALKVSASMKQVLKKQTFRITFNQAFEQVIDNCSRMPRAGQQGTWITNDMKKAYVRLHHEGHAMSVEAWQDEELVGGLYGIRIKQVFFGESMFAKVSNASKAAFITFVQEYTKNHDLALIDCQVETDHLASLGAVSIPRIKFLELLRLYKV